MIGRQVFAMILAAGRGKRMGRMKQIMPYRDSRMVDVVVDAVLESPVDGLVMVVNPKLAEDYQEHMPDRCYVAVNDDPKSEMIDSVRLGLRRLKIQGSLNPEDGVMVLLADQPQVSAGLIATCAETFRLPRNPPGILVATYRGRRGHPTVFLASLLEEVEEWEPGKGLNELARAHPESVRELPITSSPMPIDVNTPEDYDRLMESS